MDNPRGLRTAAFERMKLHKIALVAFAAIAFAVACNSTQTAQNSNSNARPSATSPASTSTPAPAATPDELAAAAADYSQFCIKCHKADGTGGPFEDEPGHTIKVTNLREHGLKDPDSHLAKQIAEGGDEMPPFKKRLDQQRIDNLVRYIRREFHGRTTTAATGAATPAQPSH
jgi:mono/diheme cytochrome c family protein